ncbi:MAG TPA: hypothetical protein VLH19_04000 [Patescibacteria group bacterium]|nr:hypothetical protein [Patescibacteria group bacterium]
MSAEQRATFFLSPEYKKDKKPEYYHSGDDAVRLFDLSFSYQGLADLTTKFGREQGTFQCVLGVMLNIWSLRQELLGEMDTRELITLAELQPDGTYKFKNDLFGQAQDLKEMYLKGADLVDPALRQRYKREASQAIEIFQALTQQELSQFHEEEIEVSPSMLAVVPSLRAQIHTPQDLQELVARKKKIKVLVGPAQLISISPPHWSHVKEKTGFVWLSECVLIPETQEMFIRQNGKFGKAKEKDLLPYLAYGQTEAQQFSSEEELMSYVNVLMEVGYRQPKVLLDFLVDKLGGLKPLGKIDKNIKAGDFDVTPYFDAISELFAYEFDDPVPHGQFLVSERLRQISDLIRHQIARNEPKALPAIVRGHKELSTANIDLYTKQIQKMAIGIDPGFRVSIDFSLLDCVAGTPLSFMNANSLAGLQANFGVEGVSLLRSLDSRSIANRSELEQFCKMFGKDAHLYSKRGTCAMCGKDTYIWPSEEGGCNVCPVCEVKDDLGLRGDFPTFQDKQDDFDGGETTGHTQGRSRSMGVGSFVASFASPEVRRPYLAVA